MAAAAIPAWWFVRTRPRRPDVGPATIDLGPESPAIVDLLTGGFVVEHDAVAATLLDLAARDWLMVEEVAGGKVIVRVGSGGRDVTTPYEDRLIRHVKDLAVDGVVPAERLSTGPAAQAGRWWRGFVREVTADARKRGLCRRRWGLGALAWVWGGVLLAAGGAALTLVTAERAPAGTVRGVDNLLVAGVLLGAAGLGWLAARLTRSDAQRDTDEGLRAASHWLGVRAHLEQNPDFGEKPAASVVLWDRPLAYATAMGLAPTVERQLPIGAERDRKAWSRATGTWRPVRVVYPRLRPGWGMAPWGALGSGLVQAAVTGALVYGGLLVARGEVDAVADLEPETRDWVTLGGLVVAAVLLPVVLWAGSRAVLGLVDLIPRRTFEGLVVRKRLVKTGDWLPRPLQWLIWSAQDQHSGVSREASRRRTRYFAVDDGHGRRVVAYAVRPTVFGAAAQGDSVRVRVSPLLGYVADVEVLRRAVGGSAPVLPGAAEEALDAVGAQVGRWSEGLSGSLTELESMTDEDGRPLLDAVDEDGVPLRQRLQEARAQLEQADLDRLGRALPRRGDGSPAIEGLGSLLGGFLGGSADAPAEPDHDPPTGPNREP